MNWKTGSPHLLAQAGCTFQKDVFGGWAQRHTSERQTTSASGVLPSLHKFNIAAVCSDCRRLYGICAAVIERPPFRRQQVAIPFFPSLCMGTMVCMLLQMSAHMSINMSKQIPHRPPTHPTRARARTHTDGRTDGQKGGRKGGRTGERAKGRADGRKGGRTDR